MRAQRVVLVRSRQPEHGHRLLAEQLLDRAPVAQHDLLQRRQPARHHPARRLDVELLVDQQLDDAHRNDLPRELRRPLRHLGRCPVGHQRRIVLEDPPLERAELLARLHPRLLDDREPRLLIGGERVEPPVGAVERQHLQPTQALVRRMLARQRVQLADRLAVQPELELRLEAHLERVQPLLLETTDRILREAPVGEVGQRRPRPEPERLSQRARPLPRRHPPRLQHEPLEAAHVDRLGIDPQPVAGRPRLERLGAEQLPQARHAVLHVGRRRGRRSPLPQLVDQPVERHDVVRLQEEERHQRALLRPTQPDRHTPHTSLQRAQHAELDLWSCHGEGERTPTHRSAQDPE